MSGIEVNTNPVMCRFLIQNTDYFQKDPFILVDVGARDGFNAEWENFTDGARIYCFEPDIEECTRLNADAPSHVTYIPTALGSEPGEGLIYETRLPYSSGLYESRMDFFSRLLNRDNAEVFGHTSVQLDTLDQALAREGVSSVDFIKLDAEGAELDILKGGKNILSGSTLLGILTEYRFHPEINGSAPFWMMDQFLQEEGFRLFDIAAYPQSRRGLPYPGVNDYFMSDGTRFYAYTTHGQVMDGDALYYRDLLIEMNLDSGKSMSPVKLLKLAALYELYHHNDAAAEVLITFREQLEDIVDCDKLLDLLTPEFYGKKLGYTDYMQKYFDPETSFSTPVLVNNAAPPIGRVRNLLKAIRYFMIGR